MRNNQGKNNLRISVDADTSKLDKDLNKSLNKTQEIRKAFRENLNKGIDMLDRQLLPPMEQRETLAREHFEGRTMNLEGKRLQIAKEQLALSEKRKKNEEEIALIKEQLRDAESRKQTFSSTASSLKNQTNTKLEEMSLLANKERQLKSELAKIEENLAKYSDRRMEQLQGKLKSAAEQVNQLKQEIESLGDVSTGRVDSLKNETNEIAKQKDLVEKRLEAQLKSVNLTRTATKDDVGRTLAELENRKRQLLVSPRTGQSITEDEYYAQPLKYQTRDKTNELKKLNEDIKFLSTEGSGTFKGLTNELESLSREYDSLLQKVGDLNTKLQTKQSLESQLSKALPKEIEARNNLESFKESQPRRVEELQGHKAVAEASLKSVADEMEELNATYRENSEALRINNEEKDRAIEQATKLKSQLETLKEAQSTVTKETQKDIKANKQLYTELKVAAEQRDSTAKFFTDQMKQYVSWTLAIGTMVKTLRASYAFISELDKALTEIATTTKMTSEQTWQLAKDYNVLGKELSKSTVEIAQSAAIFYRQGKSIAETNSMMRSVIVASSLEGVPMEETASRITAALNAYKKEATEAMSVTSKFAAVGAASATSFGELSYALTKVGAGANLAGFDFDHLLGTLATVLETTREAPENIGKHYCHFI